MRIVVLGGNGDMGTRVACRLEDGGHMVVRASRATGVDVMSGVGLAEAFAGADTVVDCLNVTTMSRKAAVGFFGGAARRVVAATAAAGVAHVAVLSIVGVTRPEVRRAVGYYAGKATHEDTYAASARSVTVVATTAWFTLAEQFLTQARIGPVALVPAMTLQPVHPDATADLLVEAAVGGPGSGRLELAGPERHTAPEMARAFARAAGLRTRVVAVPFPARRFREEALVPGSGIPQDGRRFEDWLRSLRG